MRKTLSQEIHGVKSQDAVQAGRSLTSLINQNDLVGDLIKIDYRQCDILVHDHAKQKVQGLPLGCFLLATRLRPDSIIDIGGEDACMLLLRVTGQSKLPNDSETNLSRFSAGQRVATHDDVWDADGRIDQFTLHQLRYAGVSCRVLGTFRVRDGGSDGWRLVFGADISNFYAGRGMKIYKPVGTPLSQIVNFARPFTDDKHPLAGSRVSIGRVRYAASQVQISPELENVEVFLDPTDLVARRTALFGMSRTGKSNTTKIIAGSVFRLRQASARSGRIGQLIFDVNGEYANENTQDGTKPNAASLRNLAQHTINSLQGDIVTYGLTPHHNDPNRKIVKINFLGMEPSKWTNDENVASALESLHVGKSLIDNILAVETSKYITNFRNTSLEPPKSLDFGSATRYRRVIFCYRAALSAAGFTAPPAIQTPSIKSLFGQDLIVALNNSTSSESQLYSRTASIFSKDRVSWDEAVEGCKGLRRFIHDSGSGYGDFNSDYARTHDGRSWHDDQLTGILSIFEYPNGPRAFRSLIAQHGHASFGDYAKHVTEDLLAGRLVIFDQSLGDPALNKAASERIMWSVFNRQKDQFISPQIDDKGNLIPPSDVLIYAEEAHNLLPANGAADTSNIWSRVAKEGSKYRIGLVYATQEPSSIQSSIMKNTDNWFVAHLNNTDETKELKKYYDFEDFIPSILQVAEPGFLRMRTLSNPYIVPVQVNRFRVV